jgi:hypothetical protein
MIFPLTREEITMYEGYSGQARKAIQLAQREAERLRQEYLGTEHLLLGVLREGSPGLVRLLTAFGTDPEKLYRDLEADLPRGSGVVIWIKMPLTPGAKRALQRAREAAEELQHSCVGPEHLLLGVLHEPDSTAAELLLPLGITPEKVRQELKALPEPANRDWLTRPEPTATGDPSAPELEEVLSAAPLPSPDLPARESPAPVAEVQVRIPDVRLESPVVERQLEALQVLVCGLGGALIGAARMGLVGAVVAAFCGCLVACLLIAVKSNFLARVVGCAAGITCGWLYGPGNILGNVILALLCGGAGLVLGVCLGDWRKLMGSPQTVPESSAKTTVETFTASESAVKKSVETFTEQT